MTATVQHVGLRLSIPQLEEKIEAFCARWRIIEFAFFGSVLRDDFRPDSDIDVLVTFHPECRYGLWDVSQMEDELKEIFGRDVDLLTRRGVELSRNAQRKKSILESAEVMHVGQ